MLGIYTVPEESLGLGIPILAGQNGTSSRRWLEDDSHSRQTTSAICTCDDILDTIGIRQGTQLFFQHHLFQIKKKKSTTHIFCIRKNVLFI